MWYDKQRLAATWTWPQCDFWIKIKRKVDFIYTDELIGLWLFTDSDILINCLIIKYLWIDIYRDFSTFPLYQAPNFCACAVTNAFLYIPIPTLFTYWIVSTVIHTPTTCTNKSLNMPRHMFIIGRIASNNFIILYCNWKYKGVWNLNFIS